MVNAQRFPSNVGKSVLWTFPQLLAGRNFRGLFNLRIDTKDPSASSLQAKSNHIQSILPASIHPLFFINSLVYICKFASLYSAYRTDLTTDVNNMNKYQMRTLILDSGERLPLLLNDAGVPVHGPTVYCVAELRNRHRAANTIANAISALSLFQNSSMKMLLTLHSG